MKKYTYGNPIQTEAAVLEIPDSSGTPEFGTVETEKGFLTFRASLGTQDIVYGLGETVRGINKRGWEYISWNTDDPEHVEDKRSLYASHNFIIVDGAKPWGLFVDQPGKVTFDIGYTRSDELRIVCDENVRLYFIEGDTPYEIARSFRKLIGRSYVAPKFAFGYCQSRWGYRSANDLNQVADSFDRHQIPIDMLSMDIDYMVNYKDFTVNEKEFGNDFAAFVQSMTDRSLHLVPNVDAAIKKEEGYSVYEEGVKNNYFCKLEDQTTDFTGAVWPGYAMLPDFFNPEARKWFGDHYRMMTDAGVDGFWNDMNEPALFYSEQGMKELKKYLADFAADSDAPRDCFEDFALSEHVAGIKNSMEDYRRFWHCYDGNWIRHDLVHNMYGMKMTQAGSEAFERLRPGKRTLLFSRSSIIGAHRYSGVWTGDNKSWWSHIPLLIHQLPGLNMCGFLYTGGDLGGFGADTTPELLIRFMQVGVFTPIMRNHSALGTREQEPYQFEEREDIAHIIKVRYRLLPWIYSEYMKAVLHDDLMFRPLSFDWPEDQMARRIEDQLLVGHEIMIAPVTEPNAEGRTVYLPEDMMKTVLNRDGTVDTEILEKGLHYVPYPTDQVIFFIRKNRAIPLAETAMRSADLNEKNLTMIGWPEAEYERYFDDGISTDLSSGKTEILKRNTH